MGNDTPESLISPDLRECAAETIQELYTSAGYDNFNPYNLSLGERMGEVYYEVGGEKIMAESLGVYRAEGRYQTEWDVYRLSDESSSKYAIGTHDVFVNTNSEGAVSMVTRSITPIDGKNSLQVITTQPLNEKGSDAGAITELETNLIPTNKQEYSDFEMNFEWEEFDGKLRRGDGVNLPTVVMVDASYVNVHNLADKILEALHGVREFVFREDCHMIVTSALASGKLEDLGKLARILVSRSPAKFKVEENPQEAVLLASNAVREIMPAN